MRFVRSHFGLALTAAALACTSPAEPLDSAVLIQSTAAAGNGVVASASGGGTLNLSTVAGLSDATFSFSAQVKADGSTLGHFRMSRLRNGQLVEFAGQVTCLSVDAERGRARIGGIITENTSTDPAFLTSNHEVGDDVWFRVEDGGEGADAADQSTTYGFKPTLVNTSAEYCALPFTGLPWWNPASTFPISAGNIQVRP